MTRDSASDQKAQRLVFIVGLAIGLSILGDSFLYGNLPIEAENLGIALPLVGVLLSANRLVRLISNTWASAFFERFGPRKPFIASTILALITTALYGVGWGFTVFLLARMGWGIAWSALRQGGYQAVWTGGPYAKGKLMGLLWGMIRLGSAFSVLLGGYLRDLWGYRAGVLGVMSVSALAIPVALSI
ncbi:MAG: major facilitator superfamily 1, partial [Deltaproteobacteria bacterium]|nr:major facilitator superfamily 1 [Deltaproteobacteria bacterium]